MVNENINNLMDEIEIEEEFKFIKEEFGEESLEKLNQASKDIVTKAAGTAAQIGVSTAVSSTFFAGQTILGPIVGALAGGFISPIVVGLVSALMNYKKIIEFYKKKMSSINDPEKKSVMQAKISNLTKKISEKRTKLNEARSNIIKQTSEMRNKINEMERNKNKLSPAELVTLEKYKKIVSNRMKVIPKLNG